LRVACSRQRLLSLHCERQFKMKTVRHNKNSKVFTVLSFLWSKQGGL